ncbi:MAG: hypothetical protein U9Q15_00925, partial [Patescibacteria group bacterium]|nr:hypothetical protein [Patescibacteria group bacterium]
MEPKKLVLLLQEVQDILVSYKSETDIVKRSELIFDGVMKAYVVFMTLEDLKQGREVHNMIKELITEFLISWSTSKELSDYQKLLMYSMISYSSSIKIGEEYLHQFVEGFLVLSEREKIVTLLSSFSLLAMDLSLKNKKLSDIDWIDASLLYNILDYYADYAQKNTILLQNSIPDIYLLDINVRTEYILFYSSASEDVLMERIGLP